MAALHINARFLTQRASGTQRYAEEILNAIDQQADGWPQAAACLWNPALRRGDPERARSAGGWLAAGAAHDRLGAAR